MQGSWEIGPANTVGYWSTPETKIYLIPGMEVQVMNWYNARAMMLPESGFSRSSSPDVELTVLWLPHAVSIVSWRTGGDEAAAPILHERVPADKCGVGQYLELIKKASSRTEVRNPRTVWILPEALFPSCYEQAGREGRFVSVLPDWIRDCWSALPVRAIPAVILDGMKAVADALQQWETFSCPGTGYLFRLENRFVFFGQHTESVYIRVTRAALDDTKACGLQVDWLRQTQMLYSQHSGKELSRLLLSEPILDQECTESLPGEYISTEVVGYPFRAGPEQAILPEPAIGCLHQCSLVSSRSKSSQALTFNFLEQKKNRERWGRRFRGACGFLLLGWACSIVGACQSEPESDTDSLGRFPEWEEQELRWKRQHARWKTGQSIIQARAAPFRLTGTLGRSLPEEIQLNRLQLSQGTGQPASSSLVVEMEGSCSGPEATRVLRDWLQALRDGKSLINIENLKVSRPSGVLEFSLRAIADPEGG